MQSGPVRRLGQVTLIHAGAEWFVRLVPCLLEQSYVLALMCVKGIRPESERETPGCSPAYEPKTLLSRMEGTSHRRRQGASQAEESGWVYI